MIGGYLLDTHTLLWAAYAPHLLGTKTAEILSESTHQILVSAVSAYEIAIKVRAGRLTDAEELEGNFVPKLRQAGYTLLPISVEDGLRAGRLVLPHKDPFDRLLMAQAMNLDVPILSKDRFFDAFGIRRIW